MPRLHANGIEIEYEEEGDAGSPPLLLVNGLGGQLIGWSEEWRAALVRRGFRVVRFDNRDAGLSTWFDAAGAPDVIGGWAAQEPVAPAYAIEDMADDAAGLIDALELGPAHVVGVSMGGMIAQALAIRHPDRVRSLCSIMSTSGAPGIGTPSPAALQVLLRRPETEREARIEQAVETFRVIGSPGYPFDEERERARCAAAFDRANHPAGVARQLVAIVTAGDRTAALGGLKVPTLVVHGAEDPLISVGGGEATAAAVPGSTLLVLPGMGHDIPLALVDTIADAVLANAERASGAPGAAA